MSVACAAAGCGDPANSDSTVPDAAVADSTVPDAAVPDAAVPDAAVPDAAPPDLGTARVSGNAFTFTATGGSIVDGTVGIRELPGVTARTGENGAFVFEALPVGRKVTFFLEFSDYPPIQTGTLTVPPEGLSRVTFQAPDPGMFRTLATLLRLTPDPTRCQIASTVTRVGNSLYDETPGTHGEPDATVELLPWPGAESGADGPVYFNLVRYNAIFPDRRLQATTADGGVLFLNVPPGRYTLVAHKPDTVFRDAEIDCRPGVLTNASPPWGVQAVSGGVGPRTEPDWP